MPRLVRLVRLMKGWKNAHINQSLHKVMYPPTPWVETIVYIKKENGSIVYNGPHDSVSRKRLEKYFRDEREAIKSQRFEKRVGEESCFMY
jgi:ABC-type phosphate/phosphonate transport system ATPase subunit